MSNLLIDIGNSEVKIGLGNNDNPDVKLLIRFPYSKTNFENDFESNFERLNAKIFFDKIGVTVLNVNRKKFISKFFMMRPVFIDRSSNLPIKIDYSEGIGNDRICNAVAVTGIFSNRNILVIDLGTATTFTLVSNKVLKGGMISPGIKTSLHSLIEKTSLPEVKLNFPKNLFNNNTPDSIKAGILYSSLYSAERVINEVKKKYPRLLVIATGGFSKLISGRTKLIDKVDENLVLKGINILISK